jgi:hypothetical protein
MEGLGVCITVAPLGILDSVPYISAYCVGHVAHDGQDYQLSEQRVFQQFWQTAEKYCQAGK